MKKISVSLPDEVVEILDKKLVGKLGKEHSDILRTIIMNWLGEQGYLAKGGKQEKPKDHQSMEKHHPENETFYTS